MADTHFANPFAEGADPAVVRDGVRYLWSQSEGNVAVSVWVSDRPTALGTRHIVWTAPDDGPVSHEVWAPQLQADDGRWYIYFSASDGDPDHHLAYVLESEGDDPLGPYACRGPLATGETLDATPIWAIDLTVLPHAGSRYAIWSGWPSADEQHQDLYIAPMSSPTTISGDRVLIKRAGEFDWERIDEAPDSRALVEGPRVLQRDRTFVVYSCSASWLPSYRLGVMELVGDDPLDPAGWESSPKPLFAPNAATFGVGHSTFTTSPDGREAWHIFHAKRDRQPGWQRVLFAQPMRWRADGRPDLGGEPVPAITPVALPTGLGSSVTTARAWEFGGGDEAMDGLDYYGHHQYLRSEPDGLHVGQEPAHPVNEFRSGEKLVVRDGDYRDFVAELDIEVRANGHDVGLLLRTLRPAVGFDAQRGYFAGLSTLRQAVVIGAMDGTSWRELGAAPAILATEALHRMRVTVRGDEISLAIGDDSPVLTVRDADHRRGSVGFRVVDSYARISRLAVTPL
jgi:GH43 family beta-xylosidase